MFHRLHEARVEQYMRCGFDGEQGGVQTVANKGWDGTTITLAVNGSRDLLFKRNSSQICFAALQPNCPSGFLQERG